MAMTDAQKRKEPEPDTAAVAEEKTEAKPAAEANSVVDKPAAEASEAPEAKRLKPNPPDETKESPAAEVKPADATTKAAAPTSEEPGAKKSKTNTPDLAAVKKQVEYYLCDDNLRHDKFFHEKISGNSEGWLDINLVLSCNKMKTMRATREHVLDALKDSKIEVREGGEFIRRPGNLQLPTLEARPQHQKKSSLHAHDGGVIAVFKNIPEAEKWTAVKDKLRAKMPDKVALWFVSEVSDKKQCIIAAAPFEGDVPFFEGLQLEVGGTMLQCEVAQGDSLQSALKILPKNIRDKREKEARKRQKERNRPIVVGSMKFVNVAALRGRIKEILNSRSDGEKLKPDSTDFKLVKALLGFHPKGTEKSEGMVGIKVAKSSQGDSRCFYMIKGDGVEEDFSSKKCLDAVEQNPPYMEPEDKKAKASAQPPAKETPEKKESAAAPPASGEATASGQPAMMKKPAAAEKPAEATAVTATEPAKE